MNNNFSAGQGDYDEPGLCQREHPLRSGLEPKSRYVQCGDVVSGTLCRLNTGMEHELVENVVIFYPLHLYDKELFLSPEVIVSTLHALLRVKRSFPRDI